MTALKRLALAAAVAGGVFAVSTSAAPRATAIRLATVVPTLSPWHLALNDMKASWEKDTAGRVTLTVFPNGSLGSDSAVVRSMRSNGIQATLMLLSGLAQIDESFSALGMPFFFQSDAEAAAVVAKLTPLIESRIAARGFHLLGWTNGGWVQIFSKNPLRTLADVKKAKLFTAEGDTKMVQWYKTNGFNPVSLDPNSVAAQLKLGMIDATPSPAYVASLLGMYRDAPNMLGVHVAPLLGALVVTTATWNTISAEDQAKMTAAAKTFETKTSASMPKLDADAIETMKTKGLNVITMDAAAAADLHAQADRLLASMRGDMVPADVYDLAKTARDAFRAGKTPGSK